MATEAMKKRGKAAREKGARFERSLSKLFNEWGFNTHRGYVQFKQSDVIGLPGIHVEAKAVESLNVRKAFKQAEAEAKKRKDGFPALFWKKNREDVLVVIRLDHFLTMLTIILKKCPDFDEVANKLGKYTTQEGEN